MANQAQEFFDSFKQSMGKMQQLTPDVFNGFSGLFTKLMKDGAITAREKELIALGIALAVSCEPCIRLHVKKALDAGATKDQILEVPGVAVMMAGGPAYTHIPILLETLEALTS
jgi:AhpD family alkylhydroperoxidase